MRSGATRSASGSASRATPRLDLRLSSASPTSASILRLDCSSFALLLRFIIHRHR